MFLPAFVLILSLMPVLERFQHLVWIKAAMRATSAAVIGCLAVALTQLAPHAVPDAFATGVFAIAAAVLLLWRVGPAAARPRGGGARHAQPLRAASVAQRIGLLKRTAGCASIGPSLSYLPSECTINQGGSMAKYKLCSFKTCPWVQRAAIVLQAKQVAYDITYIDRDNRPAWFLAVSPHSKVPVLQIDEKEALFESNAIAEYLDETAVAATASRGCAPARAQPRVDRLRADFRLRDLADGVLEHRGRVQHALGEDRRALQEARGCARRNAVTTGPYFNGPKFSLVDAAYAPFLQRYTFLDRLKPIGIIEKFPLLTKWRDALLASAAVKESTVPEIEEAWQQGMITNKRWLQKFVPQNVRDGDWRRRPSRVDRDAAARVPRGPCMLRRAFRARVHRSAALLQGRPRRLRLVGRRLLRSRDRGAVRPAPRSARGAGARALRLRSRPRDRCVDRRRRFANVRIMCRLFLMGGAMKALILLAALVLPALAHAGTLYKSIGPNGEIVYSDQPPQSGKVEKTFNFSNLPSTPLPDSVVKYRNELQKSMEKRLADAPPRSSR